MEHIKSTEITHLLTLNRVDVLALLNKPPRQVLVPATADVIVDHDATELKLTVRWIEKGK